MCNTCKTEVSEENALLHDFACQECGEIYVLTDNKKMIGELTNRVARSERRRKEVLAELEKVREVKKKKIVRRPPTLNEVKQWIEKAKKLPRKIEY